jgi:hypothetical protein
VLNDAKELGQPTTSRYLKAMTATAVRLLDEFKRLDPLEQRLVWNELAQAVVPLAYGPLTDEELVTIADQTFVLLDKEEADAQPR